MSLAKGVRFQCQRCGRCCHTREDAGIVELTRADQVRLARFFETSVEELVDRWCQRIGDMIALRDKQGTSACILLEPGGCRAWKARPLQCRTWPFWPEHLKKGAFEREVAPICPGVGKGRLWDGETVRVIARLQRRADRSAR